MKAYRFRILSDDNEDFFRDVEILERQTFDDLRIIVHKCVELPSLELSSFYQCNSSWEKIQEITLMDMSEEEKPMKTMAESVVGEFIESPAQRFLYEYDFLHPVTFFIQLVKTFDAKVKNGYPRCAGGEGIMKFRDVSKISAGIDYELIDEFNELLKGDLSDLDNEFYPDSDN